MDRIVQLNWKLLLWKTWRIFKSAKSRPETKEPKVKAAKSIAFLNSI